MSDWEERLKKAETFMALEKMKQLILRDIDVYEEQIQGIRIRIAEARELLKMVDAKYRKMVIV